MGAITAVMQKTGIKGVVTQPLLQFVDARGKVQHMMSLASPLFLRFGEIYFSTVNSGAVKAWKKHSRMTQHFATPVGKVRLVVFDNRPDSPTLGSLEIFEVGEDNYTLIRIPPLVWYGIKGLSERPSLMANFTDIPHAPEEQENADPSDSRIPYRW